MNQLLCNSYLHLLKEGNNRSFGDTGCWNMMPSFVGHHMRAVHRKSHERCEIYVTGAPEAAINIVGKLE